MSPIIQIKILIESFVNKTLDIQGAVLVSSEGLPLASSFSSIFDEDKAAVITISLLSLGKKFEEDLNTGKIEEIVIRGKEGYCVLTGCSNDLLLSVIANRDVIKGWLFFEIKNLVEKINLIVQKNLSNENEILLL